MLKMINTNKVETGKRIKNLREEAGYNSQESFAEKLGYSRQTVAKWENGKTMPTLDTLYDIVSVLDCDMGYLLCLYDTRYFKHAEICEETGLSEEAVNLLIEYKKNGIDFPKNFINEFLLNENLQQELLNVENTFSTLSTLLFLEDDIEIGEKAYIEANRMYSYSISESSSRGEKNTREIAKSIFDSGILSIGKDELTEKYFEYIVKQWEERGIIKKETNTRGLFYILKAKESLKKDIRDFQFSIVPLIDKILCFDNYFKEKKENWKKLKASKG